MIIYEKEHSYMMIAQHDHARISGDLVSALHDDLFSSAARRDDLTCAAYEHDSSWIDLDRAPLWNDEEHRPYSFRDFPGNIRFVFYTLALDKLQRENEYAALLGSILYTTLAERFRNKDTISFVEKEFKRQSGIIERLGINVSLLHMHAKALLLCDELSLFVCMEEPGTPRERYEWFGDGFVNGVDRSGQTKLYADWVDKNTIELEPFLFQREIASILPYKEVKKSDIAIYGIAKAYEREAFQQHKLLFRGKGRRP